MERYPVIEGAATYEKRNGSIGILVCHGFVGTPQSVRAICEQFSAQGYSVLAPRLKGHGTHYTDLERCTGDDWFQSLEQAYLQLATYCTDIYVVGQSMGGTLALQLISKYSVIRGLILINAALSVPTLTEMVKTATSRYVPAEKPDIKAADVEEITYDKIPIAAIRQLHHVIDRTVPILSQVRCPILAITSTIDHVVPPENSATILRAVASEVKKSVMLHNSYHVATLDHDQAVIVQETDHFISEIQTEAKRLVW